MKQKAKKTAASVQEPVIKNDAPTTMREVGEILTTLLDAAAPVTPVPAPANGEKSFQFTKRAHFRVMNSFYPEQLWEMFKGQYEVDLQAVEYAILAMQQEDNKDKKLEADVDGKPVGFLETCGLQVTAACLTHLDGLFVPRRWISQKDRPAGNYSGSVEDGSVVAGCGPCKEIYIADVIAQNKRLQPKDQKRIPLFVPRADAEAFVNRQKARGELIHRIGGRLEELRKNLQTREPQQDHRRY